MAESISLGDRMKLYEDMEAGRSFMPLLPVLVRLDGRAFHTFCQGLKRPYDERLSKLMAETTRFLVEESNAKIGYTQSDEITLVFYSDDIESQIFFNGRITKMISLLASQCSVIFNRLLPEYLPEKVSVHGFPTFDCRAWQVPNQTEAANCLLWRERDATKNSITMAALAHYSHNQIMYKSGEEKQEMLFQRGVNWNDYPAFFKRGTYVQRKTVTRKFSTAELDRLPPLHEARRNADLEVARTEYQLLDMPPFGRVTNREAVVFNGDTPSVGERETTFA